MTTASATEMRTAGARGSVPGSDAIVIVTATITGAGSKSVDVHGGGQGRTSGTCLRDHRGELPSWWFRSMCRAAAAAFVCVLLASQNAAVVTRIGAGLAWPGLATWRHMGRRLCGVCVCGGRGGSAATSGVVWCALRAAPSQHGQDAATQ
jgi:hypothetical protein